MGKLSLRFALGAGLASRECEVRRIQWASTVAKRGGVWFPVGMRTRWIPFFLLLGVCALTVGFSRKPKLMISVHAMGSSTDNPRTIFPQSIGNPPRQFWLKKVPEFSHFNIVAFHPFPADDGVTYGIAMQLDFKGANALEVVTRNRQGEILWSFVNGQPAGWVKIDRPISDGVFTIWSGVSEEAVQQLDKKYPRIKDVGSASSAMPMLPTTKKEKKDALRDARELAKELEDLNKQRSKEGLPPLDALPFGPLTDDIPQE